MCLFIRNEMKRIRDKTPRMNRMSKKVLPVEPVLLPPLPIPQPVSDPFLRFIDHKGGQIENAIEGRRFLSSQKGNSSSFLSTNIPTSLS